jgi:hypothetical protein
MATCLPQQTEESQYSVTRDSRTQTHIRSRRFVVVQYGRKNHAHTVFNEVAECTKTAKIFSAVYLLICYQNTSNLRLYSRMPGLG